MYIHLVKVKTGGSDLFDLYGDGVYATEKEAQTALQKDHDEGQLDLEIDDYFIAKIEVKKIMVPAKPNFKKYEV